LSLEEPVDGFEQYGNYLTAKAMHATCATYEGLAESEVTEEEPSVEDAENWTRIVSWQTGISRLRVSAQRNIDSHLTLGDDLPESPFDALESPFDVLDEMLADEEKVRKLINYIRDKSPIQFAQELASRLDFLYESVIEDAEEEPISPESLTNFIAFLQETPDVKLPDVVLTPSNEIRAQWRKGSNRHFAVAFLPTGKTRYVIFTPNPTDPDKIDRLSGTTSVDSLMHTAEPHGVLDWTTR